MDYFGFVIGLVVGLVRISGLICVSNVPVALGALRLSSHAFSHYAPADKHFAKFMHGTEYTHTLSDGAWRWDSSSADTQNAMKK